MRGSAAFRVGVAPGGALAPSWVRDSLSRAARSTPSLDLKFADNKSLVDAVSGGSLITFTRASSGTFVGSDGLIKTATTNEARFDHNPTTGESLGLLVEEQRTNLQGNSELLTAASWAPSGVTIAASGTGPNGGNAYEVTETTATAVHSFAGGGVSAVNTTSVTNGSVYTGSIFLKRSTVDWIQLSMSSTGFGLTLYINFNLATGAVGNSSGCTGTITPFANGWYRCTITATASTTTSASNNVVVGFTNNTDTTTRVPSYAGSTANKFFATMGQFELGSFATSYIPTTTSSVTRSADVASITGADFSSWFNPSQFTVFSDCRGYSAASTVTNTGGGYPYIYSLHQAGGNRLVGSRSAATNNGSWSIYASPPGSFAYSTNANFNTSLSHKVGGAYNSSSYTAYADGVIGGSVSPGTTNTLFTTLSLGSGTDGGYWGGTIKRLTYWPSRLPDSTLVEITR